MATGRGWPQAESGRTYINFTQKVNLETIELLKSKEIPIIDGRRFLDKKQFDKYSGIGLNNNLQVSEEIK